MIEALLMELKEVTDYSDFVTLRDAWQDALQRSDHSIFSTWEYLSTWWNHYGKGATLRVLVAQEKEEVLGIAPLIITKHTVFSLGCLHKIQFLGHGSDCTDFIFPKESTECLEFFLDYLFQFSDWDTLELEGINEESTTAKILLNIQNNSTSKLEFNDWSSCHYICLLHTFTDFIKGLKRNMRKELDRKMRRLRENYKVEFKTQNDFDSVNVAMETFFKLHQKRLKSKGEEGVFANEINRNFHISLAETFNEKGWLTLHFLTVDDEPISAEYCFDYNQKTYACLSGFNPDFSKFGVGTLLQMHIIEECFKKRFKEYNLGRGSMPYKIEWANGVRKNLAVTMTKRSWRVPLLLWISNIKKHLYT